MENGNEKWKMTNRSLFLLFARVRLIGEIINSLINGKWKMRNGK